MSNTTTTIGPSLHTPLVFDFYSDIKRMTFIQDIAVFQRFLAQANFKLTLLILTNESLAKKEK